jgi:tyrosinase
MDMDCLCPYIGGANCQPAIRKEYRRLTEEELDRFHAAMNQLKQSGEFSQITNLHSQLAQSSGAHAGPAFLPWHREYIKRYAKTINKRSPMVFGFCPIQYP